VCDCVIGGWVGDEKIGRWVVVSFRIVQSETAEPDQSMYIIDP